MGAKLKSREDIYVYFNETFTAKEATCKELNEQTMDMVEKNMT